MLFISKVHLLLQVTVYEDSDLFDSSECGDGATGSDGEVMGPVISVTDNNNGRENVTIVFHGVQVGGWCGHSSLYIMLLCIGRWVVRPFLPLYNVTVHWQVGGAAIPPFI